MITRNSFIFGNGFVNANDCLYIKNDLNFFHV